MPGPVTPSETSQRIVLRPFSDERLYEPKTLGLGETYEVDLHTVSKLFISQTVTTNRVPFSTKILGEFSPVNQCTGSFELIPPKSDSAAYLVGYYFWPDEGISQPLFKSATNILAEQIFDPSLYVELHNVPFLMDGDIVPGSEFKFGQTKTYNGELLEVDFNDPDLCEVFGKAEKIKQSGKPLLETAQEIAKMMDEKFSPIRRDTFVNGKKVKVGWFFKNGGYCRHRATALHMIFEKVRILSSFVRGSLAGGGPHMWVSVDVNGDGSYRYLFDPEVGNDGFIKTLDCALKLGQFEADY